ncbi:MAG TPA: PrgI family protein [Patescibacteria group bacterium]|nr:PrgI family protein [Patescibacteria group bacterium]
MQFPVPQFTDVEDKIIGSLTLKQFIIIGGAGLALFLIYTLFKDVLILIFTGLLVMPPALFLAFYKHSGRPLYSMIPQILRHYTSAKVMVFHKDVKAMPSVTKIQTVKKEETAQKVLTPVESRQRLKDLNLFLERKALEEHVVAEHPEQFTPASPKLSDLFK